MLEEKKLRRRHRVLGMFLSDCVRRTSEPVVTHQHQKRQLEKRRSLFRQPSCKNAVKILLLGAGESGKTTVIKQMKILHVQNGFSFDERLDKIHDIVENIHESIYELVRNVIMMDLEFDSVENRQYAMEIVDAGKTAPWNLSMEYVQRVRALWSDSAIKMCYKRANEFQLIDSAKYFLDRIEKISMPGYIPSNADILNCRQITTDIQEINFQIKMPSSLGGGRQAFQMIDVGGQRIHRAKWLQVFEGIDAVLFLIACGSFNQTLREDPTRNRLAESIELFRGIWHNRFLAETGMIVFLNKQDILEQKLLAGKSIGEHFPEYKEFVQRIDPEGSLPELTRSRRFIKSKLVDITNEPPRRTSHLVNGKRACYFHFTVATDTNNVRMVFDDVYNIILTRNIIEVGLF
ncbi:guanine nucleotide-binding protein G(f) subunit alpha [Uranotaenia lowii]|uniref:guanine nucleotide-binding protein G(f) subunit alpha n=1 Tax=Uranotaenia lowii TaxID=190385 RepID=UPI00247A244F|nr:guanine nucleotide-binding protein G(f) subunit alpha [Uranotaenia lowii]